MPGVPQIHEELRQAFVLLVGDDLRAKERDEVVAQMRVARPHLGAVDEVAAVDAGRPCADGREVGARVGLAHSDRERELAPHDAGQDLLALRLGAEAQQQRPALAIGHPVRAHGGARGEHLLQHDVALEEAALVATVLLGPRHADPAARADPT